MVTDQINYDKRNQYLRTTIHCRHSTDMSSMHSNILNNTMIENCFIQMFGSFKYKQGDCSTNSKKNNNQMCIHTWASLRCAAMVEWLLDWFVSTSAIVELSGEFTAKHLTWDTKLWEPQQSLSNRRKHISVKIKVAYSLGFFQVIILSAYKALFQILILSHSLSYERKYMKDRRYEGKFSSMLFSPLIFSYTSSERRKSIRKRHSESLSFLFSDSFQELNHASEGQMEHKTNVPKLWFPGNSSIAEKEIWILPLFIMWETF